MPKAKKNEWGLTVLRVVLGVIFAYHGYIKLFVPGGFVGTVKFFASVGIPIPSYAALLSAVAELAGGLLLIWGLLTTYSSLVLLFDMAVAFFYVHMKNGFLVSQGGFEFVLILAAALAVVVINGPGNFSFGKIFKSKHLH